MKPPIQGSTAGHAPEAVLEHLDWVRALARRVVGDPARAEDLSQEVALAALRRPPPGDRPLARWLGAVLRNLARRERRDAARRRAREALAARGEALPSTGELLERVSVQRRVVEAVLALEEPYRTTVLLRYFEDLPPSAIARRTGLSEATVKTRLRRGLARLRSALGGEDGRASWLNALLPFLPERAAGAATTLVLPMSIKSIALSVPLVLCAGLGLWWSARPTPAPAPVAEPPSAAAALASPQHAASVLPAEGQLAARELPMASERTEAPVSEQPPQASLAAPAPAVTLLHGRVVDVELRGVPDVLVRIASHSDPVREARSQADGRFSIALGEERGGRLTIADERYVLVLGATVRHDLEGESTLVVAPGRLVEGVVVDERGDPVAHAELRCTTGMDLRRRIEAAMDFASVERWSVRADAQGAFVFAAVPELPETRLEASAFGHVATEAALEPYGDQRVRVVLPRAVPQDGGVRGRVVDALGEPVEDAWVAAGGRSVRSDAEGRFQLEAQDAEGLRLIAAALGALPGTLERAEGQPWPAFVELVLGARPLTIRGRVLDEHGAPIAGAKVQPLGSTQLGFAPVTQASQEILTPLTVEEVLEGRQAFDEDVQTDAAGRFVLGGLLPQAYELFVADPARMAFARSGSVPAGSEGVEVVVRASGRSGPLRGRIVDGQGQPIPGVSVRTERRDPAQRFFQGEERVSDEDGRFAYEEVAYDDLHLGLFGGPIALFEDRALGPDDDPRALEIVIEARGHVLVDLGDRPELADSFRLFDPEGREVGLSWSDDSVSMLRNEGSIVAGRSEPYSVPSGVYSLALYKDGVEVERIPARIAAGEVFAARF